MKNRAISTTVLLVTLVGISLQANAAPRQSSTGASCESVGTARKDGKASDGTTQNCMWDFCTYTECNTSGGQISGCVRKTEYSNPTDCHKAAKINRKLLPELNALPQSKVVQ